MFNRNKKLKNDSENFDGERSNEDKYQMINAKDYAKEYPVDYIYVGYANMYPEKATFESCGEVKYNYARWDFFLANRKLFDNDSASKECFVKQLTGKNAGRIYKVNQTALSVVIKTDNEGQDFEYVFAFSDGLRSKTTLCHGLDLEEGQQFITGGKLMAAADMTNNGLRLNAMQRAKEKKLSSQKTAEILAAEFGEEE